MPVQFKPVADFGLLVTFAEVFDPKAHDQIRALDAALNKDMPAGVIETVPALVNLMVVFDPLQTDHETVQGRVVQALEAATTVRHTPKTCIVDVCYEGPFAPDLAAVARAVGMTEDAVIAAHLSGDYDVRMFGFAPGYGYLGGVPDPLQVPRKTAAVPDVPIGSVMIAGPQCLVTTVTMPSGWSVIGRSPTPILTMDADTPTMFDVGDRVHFNRISVDDFTQANHG